MGKTRRAFKKRRKGIAARRSSQGADLRDDIFLDRRELVCGEAVHNCSLRTQGRRSTEVQSHRNCFFVSLASVLFTIGDSKVLAGKRSAFERRMTGIHSVLCSESDNQAESPELRASRSGAQGGLRS